MSPKAFVDRNVELFKESEALLLITPDRFIRTTDPDHTLAAQEMVRRSLPLATSISARMRAGTAPTKDSALKAMW